jgi:putative PIN family toxin of toxin-antitoxin system
MPLVVFDTMVFVRGLINPRSIWGRLLFHYCERYSLVFSQPLVIELLDVLRRPEVHRKFRTVAGLDLRRVLQIIGEAAWVDVTDVPLVSRDPKDDKFLATAKAAGAAYLVSEDQDLLVLGSYEGVRITSASSFMRLVATSGPGI